MELQIEEFYITLHVTTNHRHHHSSLVAFRLEVKELILPKSQKKHNESRLYV